MKLWKKTKKKINKSSQRPNPQKRLRTWKWFKTISKNSKMKKMKKRPKKKRLPNKT
jgi:hypothetical protein